jgi:hypothetical protein
MNSAWRTCKAWTCRNLFTDGIRGQLRERAAPADLAGVPAMVLQRWFCILTWVNFPVEILMLEIAALIRPYFAGSWNSLWTKRLMP